MFARVVLVLVIAFVAADTAAGVPMRSLLPAGPDPLDGATSIFEATVVSVVAPKGEAPGRVRLVVSSDWRRLYRGFEFLGRTVDVPFRGPYFKGSLAAAKAAPGTRYLFAVGNTNELAMVAALASKGRFHMTGRAPLASSRGQSARRGILFSGRGRGTLYQYFETHLRARFWDDRSAFLDAVTATAKDASAPLDAAAIERLVDQLAASDFAKRERAHRDLVEAGLGDAAALRRALELARTLEARRRLGRIERQIAFRAAARRARAEIEARGSSAARELEEMGPRPAAATRQLNRPR